MGRSSDHASRPRPHPPSTHPGKRGEALRGQSPPPFPSSTAARPCHPRASRRDPTLCPLSLRLPLAILLRTLQAGATTDRRPATTATIHGVPSCCMPVLARHQNQANHAHVLPHVRVAITGSVLGSRLQRCSANAQHARQRKRANKNYYSNARHFIAIAIFFELTTC